MKHFFFIFLCINMQIGFTQNSYEFTISLPPNAPNIHAVENIHFGIYAGKESYPSFEVNAAGIFINSLAIRSISADSVRESSSIRVKGDFIHGIGRDSLPCVLDNDVYYFGIVSKETLVDRDSKNTLRKISDTEYMLNKFENGLYIPMKVCFVNRQLQLKYFDFANEGNKELNDVKLQQTEINAYGNRTILFPNEKEWKKVLANSIYWKASDVYQKKEQ